MNLFKQPLAAKDVFSFIKKEASLELSGKVENWRKEIDGYMDERYSFLSSGLGSVNFKKVDENSKDAVGQIVWSENNMSFTIPIIIEDGKLKEPNTAIYRDKVIPLDEEFLSWTQNSNEGVGEVVKDDKDITDNMEYIAQDGLFSYDEEGQQKISADLSTIDRVKGYLQDKRIKLTDKIATFVREVTPVTAPAKDVLLKVLSENADVPYHYKVAALYRNTVGRLEVKEGTFNAEDMKKLGYISSVGYGQTENPDKPEEEYNYIRNDKNLQKIPVVKRIIDTRNCDQLLVEGKAVEGKVFNNLFAIWESKPEIKSLAIIDGEKPEDVDKWVYGDVYGSVSPETTKYEKGMFGASISTEKIDRAAETYDKTIVLFAGADSMSVPYHVIGCEDVKIGEEGNRARILKVKSLTDDKIAVLWLDHDITKILKADNKKLKTRGYSSLTWADYNVYLIPASYKVGMLKGRRIPATSYKEDYRKMIKDITGQYPIELEVEQKDVDLYKVQVADAGGKKEYDGLSKKAATVLMRYFTGDGIKDIQDIKYNTSYNIQKVAKEEEKTKPVDLSPLKRYRGSWIKTASIMCSVPEEILKKAEVKKVVDDLVGMEYMDNTNIQDMSEVEARIMKSLDDVGQLLLVARMGKTELSEAVLAKSFSALTKLIGEIRGKNEKG